MQAPPTSTISSSTRLLSVLVSMEVISPPVSTSSAVRDVLKPSTDSVHDPLLAESAMKEGFYDKRQVGDPREVAKATLMAVKRCNFLVANGSQGLILSTLSAGILPVETFGKAVLDLFEIIPARLAGYIIIAFVYIVIWLNHLTRTIFVDVANK